MVVCLLFPHPAKLEALVDACYRFTPRMSLRNSLVLGRHEALFLHLTCDPSRMLILRLQHLCGRFGLKDHQMAWSSAAPQALARARFQNRPLNQLPIDVFQDLLSPFLPDPVLEKKIAQMNSSLRKLGILNVGSFMKLPRKGLVSRFGEEAHKLYAILNDGYEEPWPSLILPEKIIEEIDLEEQGIFVPLETLEPLLFLIRRLVDCAVARLFGRNERAIKVQIDFESHRGSLTSAKSIEKRSWTFGFSVPQSSFQSIFSILKEKIYFELSRKPLEFPVSVLRLTVLDLAPGGARQKDFFHRREEEQEIWSSLVARLCERLGEEHVFCANPVSRHLPEGAWGRELREPQVKTSSEMIQSVVADIKDLPRRPTRLLHPPHLLEHKGDDLFDRKLKKTWRVVDWDGPERISGEWWAQSQFSRDYFRVLTGEGEQLWLFFSREGVFLHGFFD